MLGEPANVCNGLACEGRATHYATKMTSRIRYFARAGAISACALLASCGGGGGGEQPIIVSPAPTPTPTPTSGPTPTPSPTSTPSPSLPPESAATQFPLSESTTLQGLSMVAPGALYPLGDSKVGVEFETGALASFVVQGPIRPNRRFTNVRQMDDELTAEIAPASKLRMFANIARLLGGSGPPFRYVTYALSSDSEQVVPTDIASVFGFITQSSKLPLSGERSFKGIVRANRTLFVEGRPQTTLMRGTASVIVDYNTYNVRVRLTFGEPEIVLERTIGIGLGGGRNGSNFFAGHLIDQTQESSAFLNGAVFGPSGEEVGFTFTLTRTANGEPDRIVGAVLAN